GSSRNFIGNFPDSLAGSAVGLGLHLAEHRIHDLHLHTATVTGAACFAGGSRCKFHFLNLDGLLRSVHHFLQVQFDPDAKVAATQLLALCATTAKSASTKLTAENISKLTEDIFHIHSAAAKATTESSGSAHTGVPVLVVTCFFIVVAKYFVGFCSFFKLFFSLLIARIFIRVIFQSHFAVRFLYFISRSTFGYSQYFVVISFRHVLLYVSSGYRISSGLCPLLYNRVIVSFRLLLLQNVLPYRGGYNLFQ